MSNNIVLDAKFKVHELVSNFSHVVFSDDDIEECSDYILCRCNDRVYEMLIDGDIEANEMDDELENQMSYFSIDTK